MLQSAIKLALQQYQQLFLHPTHCPNDMSRKCMQVIYKEKCGAMLGHILDVCQLAVACDWPKNLRDLLTPSALKTCPGKENNAEFYVEGTPLVN